MAVQTNTFKGARYVPKFYGNWTADIGYEAIGVVKHNAFTYISKQPVPAGVEIDNTDFWLLWADPNAQMAELRQIFMQYVDTVGDLTGVVDGLTQDLAAEIETRETAISEVENVLPISDFSSVNTVKKYIDDLSKVSDIENGIVAASRCVTDNKFYLYYSPNGINFYTLANISNLISGDLCYIKHIGDYYYIFSNRDYIFTRDFISWTHESLVYPQTQYGLDYRYGMTFIDNVCIFSTAVSEVAVSNIFGSATKYFNLFKCTFTNEQGTIVFNDDVTEFILPDYEAGNSSFIDPDIVYTKNLGYTLAVKDEINTTFKIYNGASIDALNPVNCSTGMKGVEGCKLTANSEGQILLYGVQYAFYNEFIGYTATYRPEGKALNDCLPTLKARITNVNGSSFKQTYRFKQIKASRQMRHLGIMQVTKDIMNGIEKYKYVPEDIGYTTQNLVFTFNNPSIANLVPYNGVKYRFQNNTNSVNVKMTPNTIDNNEPTYLQCAAAEVNFNWTMVSNEDFGYGYTLPFKQDGIVGYLIRGFNDKYWLG